MAHRLELEAISLVPDPSVFVFSRRHILILNQMKEHSQKSIKNQTMTITIETTRRAHHSCPTLHFQNLPFPSPSRGILYNTLLLLAEIFLGFCLAGEGGKIFKNCYQLVGFFLHFSFPLFQKCKLFHFFLLLYL